MGRPMGYKENTVAELCAKLAEGKSLRTVCANKSMPDKSTVFRWLAKYPEFQDQYARAKEEAADALSEEMLDIADDESEDVQRSRLKVDTRKWLASKLKPKRYGERQHIEHTGNLSHILDWVEQKADEQQHPG